MHVRLLACKDQQVLAREMREIRVSERGIELMLPKAEHLVMRVYGVRHTAANILKQTLLSNGGDAAVSYHCCLGGEAQTDVLLFATARQFRAACERLKEQAFGLAGLVEQIEVLLDRNTRAPQPLKTKNADFIWGSRTYIMGIVNITPDSFSKDGLAASENPAESAARQAMRFQAEGADIIDVGGESTRPGHAPVSADTEKERILPAIRAIKDAVDLPVSVDTFKAEVAQAALEAGADWINDIWGLQFDPGMAAVAAQYHAPVVLMHNQEGTAYQSLMGDIIAFLAKSIAIAEKAGVPKEHIMVDPGIGFGKTADQNLEVLKYLADLKTLGYPILVGTSRKSLIGKVLQLPEDHRVEGTAATVALAIANGADIVRVHDVAQMTLVSRMADAVVRRDYQTRLSDAMKIQ